MTWWTCSRSTLAARSKTCCSASVPLKPSRHCSPSATMFWCASLAHTSLQPLPHPPPPPPPPPGGDGPSQSLLPLCCPSEVVSNAFGALPRPRLTAANVTQASGNEVVVASLDQFTSEMFRKEKTAVSGGPSDACSSATGLAPWLSGGEGAGSRLKRAKVPHTSAEAPPNGSPHGGDLATRHFLSSLAPPELVHDSNGAGPSAAAPGQTASDCFPDATTPAFEADPNGHEALSAWESLPPTPPAAPSENKVLAPPSHNGEGASFPGSSAAMRLSPDPPAEIQVPPTFRHAGFVPLLRPILWQLLPGWHGFGQGMCHLIPACQALCLAAWPRQPFCSTGFLVCTDCSSVIRASGMSLESRGTS